MGKNVGVPGNSMQEAANFEHQQAIYGKGLTRFDYLCSDNFRGAVEVGGFSVRPPQVQGGEWLVVVRGWDDAGAPVVGFHSALSVGEAVAGASHRVAEGLMKWKEDGYRK